MLYKNSNCELFYKNILHYDRKHKLKDLEKDKSNINSNGHNKKINNNDSLTL